MSPVRCVLGWLLSAALILAIWRLPWVEGRPAATTATGSASKDAASPPAPVRSSDRQTRTVLEPSASSPGKDGPPQTHAREVVAAPPGGAAQDVAGQTAAVAHVRGRLRSESGAWRDLDALLAGGVVIDLVSSSGPLEKRRASLVPEAEHDGTLAIAFACEDLWPGRWLLTVSSLEPELWIPGVLELDAPVAGLQIWCRDRARRVTLAFRVLDAMSGEPLENWSASALRQTPSADRGVLVHAGPLALEGFPVDSGLEWSLWAPGHAPAFGDERAFVASDDHNWVAEARLRDGWGLRLLALGRDPAMRPLPGARVWLDGQSAGTTDALGRIDLWAPERPSGLEVRWGALHARRGGLPQVDSSAARVQGHVLVVVLEPER